MDSGYVALEELIERANKAMGKVLTTKDRKKLNKSTFCGPGKSFPVPDCQHVATAKAYLGRSKFSDSTKAKIAACINKRSKILKCGGDKKAKASEEALPRFVGLSYEEKKLYGSDVFAETKALVELSIKYPGKDIEECYGTLLKDGIITES